MTARFLPLSLLLLLSQAVPAHADLKITTRIGNCTSTSTRYNQGSNHQRIYTLDAATRAYTVTRVEQPKGASLQRASDIQSERRVSEPGSCSGGGEKRIKTDGWYIDLPVARTAYSAVAFAKCNDVTDHIEFHQTGPRENGFALLETRTASDSRGVTFRTEVTELDEAPLDPKTFASPVGFHLVLALPNHRPYTFLDTLRADWASLECLNDVRYGLRMLRKSPGFTAVAVVTLALGIEIQRRDRKTGEPANWVAYRDVADWRAQNRSFESIGAHRFALLNLTAAGQPDALYGGSVSADLLPLLGVPPVAGRFFLPAEDQPGHDQEIILSYDLWQRRFAGDPSIVGRTIRLTGVHTQDYTVVGVMPRGFNFPLNVPSAVTLPTHQMAYWIPFGVDPLRQTRDGMRCLVVGRLKPGVSVAQAQEDLDAAASRIERESPQTNTGVGVRVLPFAHYVMGRARPAMLIMFGAVGLLVLIACANIANLLLARAMGRRRETGIRLALGADRRRLLRQWITESLLLAAVGGGAGLLLAASSLRFLIHLAPQDVPRLAETRLDGAVLAFSVGLWLLAGLLFGVFPAWLAAGTDLQEALAEGGARSGVPTGPGPGRSRARDLLIVGEVAVSVLLTIAAVAIPRSPVKHRLLSQVARRPAKPARRGIGRSGQRRAAFRQHHGSLRDCGRPSFGNGGNPQAIG